MDRKMRTKEEWKTIYKQVVAKVRKGMSVKAACAEAGVPEGSYSNYCARNGLPPSGSAGKVAASDERKFTRFERASFTPVGKVTVRIGDAEVVCEDAEGLRMVLEAIRGGK